LIVLSIVALVPVVWMISSSLKASTEIFVIPIRWIPQTPRWENYAEMWNALPFAAFFINSTKLAVLNTVGQLISCSMAARRWTRAARFALAMMSGSGCVRNSRSAGVVTIAARHGWAPPA
jgi:ABC-type glycerol-3-phosphate transport system permease component